MSDFGYVTMILRQMLDKRGIYWMDVNRGDRLRTCWKMDDNPMSCYYYFDELFYGATELIVSDVSPKQAVCVAEKLARKEVVE